MNKANTIPKESNFNEFLICERSFFGDEQTVCLSSLYSTFLSLVSGKKDTTSIELGTICMEVQNRVLGTWQWS